jgi:outer membrane receptor protein involved in Fe transport
VRKLTSILAAVMIAIFAVGPVSAAAAPNVPVTVAQSANATVQGTVSDDTGAPVANANVVMRGAQTYTATTDKTGAFSISVAAGIYVLAISKPGYETATATDFAVLGGQTETVQVTVHAQTFTSLRTIASVRANGAATFNTSPASINVINAQAFVDQAQPQVGRILNQIPGVQNTLPTSSANGAAPGAVTVPNIRGGLSFETATLIDGHPLAVGDFGDYVTTFLSSYLLGSVEVIKGPGAMAPETNYAINGTINFRTKDPTSEFSPDYTFGFTNHGGDYYNFGVSDTLGRLGFVVDIAGYNDPSALNGYSSYFQTYGNNGVANWNGTTGTVVSYNYTYIPSTAANAAPSAGGPGGAITGFVPGTTTALNHIYGLLACCYTYQGWYNSTGELLKFRYRFSGATTATVSYLGSQTYADQNANTSELIPSIFSPTTVGQLYYPATAPVPANGASTSSPTYGAAAATYSGALAQGTALTIPNSVYPSTAQEINNEPIFQAEVRTLLGQDTVLARFYHASIDRLIYEGNPNPTVPALGYYTLYGVNPSSKASCSATTCAPNVFNGTAQPVAFFDWYNQWEEDRLTGLTFEYDHGWGDGNDVTFSFDQTNASSAAGSQSAAFPGVVSGTNNFAPATNPLQAPSVTNPQGTSQLFTTILGRMIYNFSPQLSGTLALYDNQYTNIFPYQCTLVAAYASTNCLQDGSNAFFTSNHNAHFDQRIALTYRPKNNLSIRASAGSSIAPPYLSLLSKVNTTPTATSCTSAGFCTFNLNNPNLLPETAWGYNLGADFRLKDNVTVVSVDGYLTNLFNRFLGETYYVGTCASNTSGLVCPTGLVGTTPVAQSFNTNLNNSRYEGIELAIRRVVPEGLGFNITGAVQHAYAYNLPPNFYCAGAAFKALGGCIPSNYNVNLPIIAGQNFTGNTFGTVYGQPGGAFASTSVGASGFSNTAIPYLQGDANVNYTFKNGAYAMLGETLYGKNNGYNLPPFGIGYATIRYPLSKSLSIQVSGDNIFNAWTGLFPIVGGGIAYPLANGTLGATIGNTVGPATYSFQLTKTIGGP